MNDPKQPLTMKPMQISLYPTADGCLRPAEVLESARASLRKKKRVAISTGDPAFDVLDGAVLVRRVGKAFNAFHSINPDVAIIDALDFTCPDGIVLVSRQEEPHGQPVVVDGDPFRRTLDLLRDRSGTGEVLLVSVNDAISPAWERRLERWGVNIRWDLSDSTQWRTWLIGRPAPEEHEPAGVAETEFDGFRWLGSSVFPAPPGSHLTTVLHSPRAHVLLAMAAEFSDVFCKEEDVPGNRGFLVTEHPGQLLLRMLAGKPLDERTRVCRQLRDDLDFLSGIAGEYLDALENIGTPEAFHPGPVSPGGKGKGKGKDTRIGVRTAPPRKVH